MHGEKTVVTAFEIQLPENLKLAEAVGNNIQAKTTQNKIRLNQLHSEIFEFKSMKLIEFPRRFLQTRVLSWIWHGYVLLRRKMLLPLCKQKQEQVWTSKKLNQKNKIITAQNLLLLQHGLHFETRYLKFNSTTLFRFVLEGRVRTLWHRAKGTIAPARNLRLRQPAQDTRAKTKWVPKWEDDGWRYYSQSWLRLSSESLILF